MQPVHCHLKHWPPLLNGGMMAGRIAAVPTKFKLSGNGVLHMTIRQPAPKYSCCTNRARRICLNYPHSIRLTLWWVQVGHAWGGLSRLWGCAGTPGLVIQGQGRCDNADSAPKALRLPVNWYQYHIIFSSTLQATFMNKPVESIYHINNKFLELYLLRLLDYLVQENFLPTSFVACQCLFIYLKNQLCCLCILMLKLILQFSMCKSHHLFKFANAWIISIPDADLFFMQLNMWADCQPNGTAK